MKQRYLAAAGLSALLAAAAAPATAADLMLELTNGTSGDITEFLAAPAGSGTWLDVLGGGFLPAGNSVSVAVGDDAQGCSYDFRFGLSAGDAVEETAFDVCANKSYTLSP